MPRPYKSSHARTWCILRSNELLRKLLDAKKDELRLTYKKISEDTGISTLVLRDYFQAKPKCLTQYKLVLLANYLGYEVKLDIGVKMPTAYSFSGSP